MDSNFSTMSRAMRAGRLRLTRRALAVLAAAVAVFALAGDSGVRSATSSGQDVLDLLNLQAKANAFIILDTSGSMGDSLTATTSGVQQTGDIQPVNKLNTAKSVLQSVIAANQTTVAFSFGTYNQGGTSLTTSGNRFAYYTTSVLSPGMVTREIIATAHTTAPVMPVHRTTSDDFVDGNGVTQYQLVADRFVNGMSYTVYSNGTVCSATAGTATNPPQVTITMVNSTSSCTAATLTTAVFKWAGAYESAWGTPSTSCSGYLNRVPLAPCSQTDQLNAGGIGNYLKPSLLLSADGLTIQGYAENASGGITSQPTLGGLRSGGYTPIANSLLDLQPVWNTLWTGTILPEMTAATGVQSTFAIIVTDGADTCANRTSGGSETDSNALRAAYAAQQLYQAHNDGTNGPTRFKTFVIYLGPPNATTLARANWPAWGGTGMTHAASGSGEATQWNSTPTAAQRTACTTCVDAFTAANTDDLSAALQAAIELGQSGAFADRAVIASVYEFSPTPLDSSKWAQTAVPVEFQTTWNLPGFEGHLRAYVNASSSAVQRWDAADTLLASVSISGEATFAQLHGGATEANIGSSSALIKRRIYTSLGNGSNSNYTVSSLISQSNPSAMRAALWPPDTSTSPAVDPASGAGRFDTELGLPTDLATLQTKFGACTADTTYTWPAGHACTSATASVKLAAATKEAREMVLAFMAGAQVELTNGLPKRVPATTDSTGAVYYTKRSSVLADSTGGAPAVATPPPSELVPAALHAGEWALFQGLSSTGVLAGFALRSEAVMTVVYLPANDMLHALRAGPCPGGGCGTETGGEELWGFVPYDQLSKLTTRLISPNPPSTDHSRHNYMMAAPVRLAHVFVPVIPAGTWSLGSMSGSGVWRTVLLAGRGPGGKYLTALDVTGPGPTTTAHLSTAGPIVMWNRTYSGMGETWSVPAVGLADKTANKDSVTNANVEFVAYVGSGYSDVAGEGTTFYALDVINGNLIKDGTTGVVAQFDVGLGGGSFNALVAGPSVFQPKLLGAEPHGPGNVRLFPGRPGSDLQVRHGQAWHSTRSVQDLRFRTAFWCADDAPQLRRCWDWQLQAACLCVSRG